MSTRSPFERCILFIVASEFSIPPGPAIAGSPYWGHSLTLYWACPLLLRRSPVSHCNVRVCPLAARLCRIQYTLFLLCFTPSRVAGEGGLVVGYRKSMLRCSVVCSVEIYPVLRELMPFRWVSRTTAGAASRGNKIYFPTAVQCKTERGPCCRGPSENA